MICSHANGAVSVFQFLQSGELSQILEFKGHEYQAWVVAGHSSDPNIVYSGKYLMALISNWSRW